MYRFKLAVVVRLFSVIVRIVFFFLFFLHNDFKSHSGFCNAFVICWREKFKCLERMNEWKDVLNDHLVKLNHKIPCCFFFIYEKRFITTEWDQLFRRKKNSKETEILQINEKQNMYKEDDCVYGLGGRSVVSHLTIEPLSPLLKLSACIK